MSIFDGFFHLKFLQPSEKHFHNITTCAVVVYAKIVLIVKIAITTSTFTLNLANLECQQIDLF